MKKCIQISFLICLFLVISVGVKAHSPRNLVMEYDDSVNELMISAKHISRDRDEHYVRKVVIRVNNESPETYYIPRQIQLKQFD